MLSLGGGGSCAEEHLLVRLPFFSVPMHGGVDSGRTPGDAAGRDGATEQKK